MELLPIIQLILAPITLETLIGTILAGILFGVIFNYVLKIPEEYSYYQFISGWGFILVLFLVREATVALSGATLANPAGWLGIAIIWGIYCLFSWLSRIFAEIVVLGIKSREDKERLKLK